MEFDQLSKEIYTLSQKAQHIIAVAESCTGGMIAAQLTATPGSSQVFDRAFITYSNEAKQEMLGVSTESLEKFGAVSAAVAKEMAYGALIRSKATLALSVTGIAGPDGGSADKAVGTVWIGIATEGGSVEAKLFTFEGMDRHGVRRAATQTALELIYQKISLTL